MSSTPWPRALALGDTGCMSDNPPQQPDPPARTVADIRADVTAGRLTPLEAIGQVRKVAGCGLREAVATLRT